MSENRSILPDNNGLSHLSLPERLRGKTIYLADAVFYELFAKGNWEKSITHALAPLAPFADQVVSTVNIGIPLLRELETGQPTSSIVGDEAVTRRLPALLRACRDEPDGAVAYFRQTQHVAPEERWARMTHIPDDRDVAMDARSLMQEKLDERQLDRLRNQPTRVPQFFREIDMRSRAVDSLGHLAASADFSCPFWNPAKMAAIPCCWMRYLLADLCLGIRRAVEKGFPTATDDELHGENTDHEIIVLGTYADEFFTRDRRAIWLDSALRACIRDLF